MAKPKLRKRKPPSKQSPKGLHREQGQSDDKPSRRKTCSSIETITCSSEGKKSSRMTRSRSCESQLRSPPGTSPSTRTSRSKARSKSGNAETSIKTSTHQNPKLCEKTEILTRVEIELIPSTRTVTHSRAPSESTRSRSVSESTRTSSPPVKVSSQGESQSHPMKTSLSGANKSSFSPHLKKIKSHNARVSCLSSKSSWKSKVFSIQNGTKSHSRTLRSSEPSLTSSCSTEMLQTEGTSCQEVASSLSMKTHSLSRKPQSTGLPELRTPLRCTKRPKSVRAKVPRTPRTSSQSTDSSHLNLIKDKGPFQSKQAQKSTKTSLQPQSVPSESSEISQDHGKNPELSSNEHTPVKTFHNSYEEYVQRSSPELFSDSTSDCDNTIDVSHNLSEDRDIDQCGASESKSIPQDEKTNRREIEMSRIQPVLKETTASKRHHATGGEIETPSQTVLKETTASMRHHATGGEVKTGSQQVLKETTASKRHHAMEQDAETPQPVLKETTASKRHHATAEEIETPQPVLKETTASKRHHASGGEIETPQPVLKETTASKRHHATAEEIETPQPVLKETTASRRHHATEREDETPMDCVDAKISAKEHTTVKHNTGRVSVMDAAVQVKMIGNEAVESLQVTLDVGQDQRTICERDTDTYKAAWSRVLSESALTELIISELERQKLAEKFQGQEKLLSIFMKDIRPAHATTGSLTSVSSPDTISVPKIIDLHDDVRHNPQQKQPLQNRKRAPDNPQLTESSIMNSLSDIQALSAQSTYNFGAECKHTVQAKPHTLKKGMKSCPVEKAVCESSSLELLPDIIPMSKPNIQPQSHKICESSQVRNDAISSEQTLSLESDIHHTRVKTRKRHKEVLDQTVVSKSSTMDSLPDITETSKHTLPPSSEFCETSVLEGVSPGTKIQNQVEDKSAIDKFKSKDYPKLLDLLQKPSEESSVSGGPVQYDYQKNKSLTHNLCKRQKLESHVPTAVSDSCSMNSSSDASSKPSPRVSNEIKDLLSRKSYKEKMYASQVSAVISEPRASVSLQDFEAVPLDGGKQKDSESSSRKCYPLRHSKSDLQQEGLPEIRPKKRMKLKSQNEGTPKQKIHSDIPKTPPTSKRTDEFEYMTIDAIPERSEEDPMNEETTVQNKSSRKKICKGFRSNGTRVSPRLAATSPNLALKVSPCVSPKSQPMIAETHRAKSDLNVIEPDLDVAESEQKVFYSLPVGKQIARCKGKSTRAQGHCLKIEQHPCWKQTKQKGRSKRKPDFNVTKLSDQLDSQLSLKRSGTSPHMEARTNRPRLPKSPTDEDSQVGFEEVDTDNDSDDPVCKEIFKVPAPNTDDSMIDMMNNMLELSPVVPPCDDVDIYTEMCQSLGGERSDDGQVLDEDLPTSALDDGDSVLDSDVHGNTIETDVDLSARVVSKKAVKKGCEIAIEGKDTFIACDEQDDDANENDFIINVGDMDDDWLVLDTVGDSDEKNDLDTSITKGDDGVVNDEIVHSIDKENMKTKTGFPDSEVVTYNTIGSEGTSRENEASGDIMNDGNKSDEGVCPQKNLVVVDIIGHKDSVMELDEENIKEKKGCDVFDEEIDLSEDVKVTHFDNDDPNGCNSGIDTVNEPENINPDVAMTNVISKETENIVDSNDDDNVDAINANDDKIREEADDTQTAKDINAISSTGKGKTSETEVQIIASKHINALKPKNDKAEHNADVGTRNFDFIEATSSNAVTKTEGDPEFRVSRNTESCQVKSDDTINTDINGSNVVNSSKSKCDNTVQDIADTNLSKVFEADATETAFDSKSIKTKASADTCTTKDRESFEEGEVKMKIKCSEDDMYTNDDSILHENDLNISFNTSGLCSKKWDDSGLCLLEEDSASHKQRVRPRLSLVDYSSSSDEEL